MAMNNYTFSVSYEITSENEPWRTIMEEGLPAPEVTGGAIELPQGGTRQSKAAVTGGIFTEGSEASSYAEDNTKKMISSLLPEEIQSHIQSLLHGDSISDVESFLTNLAKSEYSKIAGEFSDNEDESIATQEVIDSLKVKLTINGLPSLEEIALQAKKEIIEKLNLGGGLS